MTRTPTRAANQHRCESVRFQEGIGGSPRNRRLQGRSVSVASVETAESRRRVVPVMTAPALTNGTRGACDPEALAATRGTES